jgi:hypothetical protein
MSPVKKHLLDKYQYYLWSDYLAFCQRQNIEADLQDFITYIIDKGHVSETHIRRYTILKEFAPLYREQAQHKTNTVETLADRFSVSQKTIWNILKYRDLQKLND